MVIRDGNELDLGRVEQKSDHEKSDSGEISDLHPRPRVKFQTQTRRVSGVRRVYKWAGPV
jgi:hypothetical protein